MKSYTVAITIRSFNDSGQAIDLLRRFFTISYINESGKRLNETELIKALDGADAVIAGTEVFSANVLTKSPQLKVISRVGVGIDSIDHLVSKSRGIQIFNTPDAPVQAVAEHTLALILSILKQISRYNENARIGEHSIYAGNLLSGKTIGVIGLGRIGFRVASLLSAFGCDITYYDPFVKAAHSIDWERKDTLNELLRNADIITLHTNSTNDQAPLMDLEAFDTCKRGAVLINTARGSCIDEEALYEALIIGTIAGAGLDVAVNEPLTGPLLDLPQVIVTPHVASNTYETRAQMELEAVNNLIEWQKEQIL
ncbi:phosphoglycerate dehydrogenase [Methanocalculus sp.]|uniref:phosphoglycerate dehydrogenase n=1 Tax=Methanocalculus sp. TaxID=2004547 RepID=UPI002624EFEF|nr:phosphoglycerate dehydrogenase [Methanocalculus sp.]MDG6251208.1 phosphoglycerate dehydrogenase [Methanocalculus sp.]